MLFATVTIFLVGVAFAHPNSCPALPKNIQLVNDTELPDPFTTIRGKPVRTRAEWTCRAQELSALFQRYELGTLPGAPRRLTSSLNANATQLTIFPTVGDVTINFTISITHPTAGTAPYPAVIAYGGLSVPVPDNIATIVFDNSAFAEQNDLSSRGQGLFYDLFTPNATASALTAWAWGVSRIIDALERTPAAQINPRRIGITGCSRNGKGALVAGAFEPRIALTIPQESGAGGTACWRLSDYQLAHNETVQTASEIVGENVWESVEFRNFANNTDLLPFDHHELAGLVAPRGLIVIDNSDYLWLGPWSSFGCMTAARKIYQALGVKHDLGLSNVGNHSHCVFPADRETPDLTAFYDRFLLNEEADTDIFYSTTNITFDQGQWIDWKTPRLWQ